MRRGQSFIPAERIEQAIIVVRGRRVMLDVNLAPLYGVTTKRVNEQVKRNVDRFPEDFMFQLTAEEWEGLKSQFATSKQGRGGRRTLPFAFTEHGAVMLANVLNSPVAVQASLETVPAVGIEPTAPASSERCSTAELRRNRWISAGRGSRTHTRRRMKAPLRLLSFAGLGISSSGVEPDLRPSQGRVPSATPRGF